MSAGLGRVSVAMATYNGAAHLAAQLESIAAQAYLPAELQIGDDGSTDATKAIVAEFARRAPFPVAFHRNPARLGYAANFLEAARRCSGDWIAFSDQDDVWLPEKLQACDAALRAEGRDDIVMICHSAAVVDAALRPTGARIPEDIRSEVRGRLGHQLNWSHYGFAQLFRRELVAEIPILPRVPTVFTDIDPYPHDVWISALGNLLGATLHLARDLCLYLRHEASVTETAKVVPERPLDAARATGADHYRHVAAVCREAARAFRTQSGEARRPDWTARMEEGARAYDALAEALETRTLVYEGRPSTRLAAVARLAGRGYFGLGASSLGARALAKDLVAAAWPAAFGGGRR